VLIEIALYGFGIYWVVLYLIHWTTLATLVNSFAKGKFKLLIAVTLAMAMTCTYGMLSTIIEVVVFANPTSVTQFWQIFGTLYLSGITFFAMHIISNAIMLPILLPITFRVAKPFATKIYAGRIYSSPTTQPN
jgi:hypothetical protein